VESLLRRKLDTYVPAIEIYSSMDRNGTIFLDSSMENDLGRYSIIGMIPNRRLTYHSDKGLDGISAGISLTQLIDAELSSYVPDIGFSQSLIGWISYDAGMDIIGVSSKHEITNVPDSVLIRFDVLIIEDHLNRATEIICNGIVKDPDVEFQELMKIIASIGKLNVPDGRGYEIRSDVGKDDYISSIKKAKELMRCGEMYVMNMTHTMEIVSDSEPFGTFLRLRSISPSPFGAYIDVDGIQIISSSMELLADIEGRSVRTRPIKGTAPRTGDIEKDACNLKGLISSNKERSELLMITDLERNDMNRFCIPGTVRVERFAVPEEYSTVFHTVSDISGSMKEGITIGDVISCMFPGGSVTGAPKLNAMRYIDDLEDRRRGIYTGMICILSPGRSIMNIAIRTMVHKDGVYTIGVGGGITYESDPEEEYNETMQKAKAMLRSLE
jgi:para-aminobenzoate synthetase component I